MSFDAADPEAWKKRWEVGSTGWHEPNGNRWLTSNVHVLTGGREKVRVFIPLCGKSKDIKWLVDNGHEVVGVELSSLALEQFFSENHVPYQVQPIFQCSGSLYKSEDGRIQLYCCNIFDVNRDMCGLFDAIWDRGSMVAMPPEQLEKYHAIVESLMAPGCQYLFERLDYFVPGRTGPPSCVPMETVHRLFGAKCKIEVIDRFPSPKDKERFKADFFYIEIIRITHML